MNKMIIVLAIFGCWACHVHAQAPEPRALQVRHALFVHAGGAEVGVGPGYELQLSKPGGFTLGCALGLPLVHSTWHRYYSPISLSPAINLMHGRRAWKMELATEYNYFLEWGREASGERTPYTVHTLAWMGGVRRQLPWTGLIVRANLGVKVLDIGPRAKLLPAATVSLGYLMGSRNTPETKLPPKPIFHFGHHVGPAYSGGHKTLQLQVAPMVSAGLQRASPPFKTYSTQLYKWTYDYQFQTQWAAQAGLMADLGNADAIAGLRLGLNVGLRQINIDWRERIYHNSTSGYRLSGDSQTHIEDLQLTFEMSACLRLRTLQANPWILQVGAATGTTRSLRDNSTYSNEFYPSQGISPNTPGYGIGPLLRASKQFQIGNHAIEPFISSQGSFYLYRYMPQLNHWSTTAGVMLWL